eukprot:7809551-Karenia_brevis.AAC.1
MGSSVAAGRPANHSGVVRIQNNERTRMLLMWSNTHSGLSQQRSRQVTPPSSPWPLAAGQKQ